MTLILSHTTALLFHRLPRPSPPPLAFPEQPSPLRSGSPTEEEVERARSLLIERGIPHDQVEVIDVLVSTPGERRRMRGVRYHVCSLVLPHHSLWRIEPGLFVVDPVFARWRRLRT